VVTPHPNSKMEEPWGNKDLIKSTAFSPIDPLINVGYF
jgi:hypothetical protein